ncbi:MAG: biotin/lipoyl-binding protein, partial [Muribaculaceae bacterium]|nr:biotin/lipoyl-binding protein [Muribaculaceae bacterium]
MLILVAVVAAMAIWGIMHLRPSDKAIQGQADCEVVRISGKLAGRLVELYVKEGDYVHAGDTLAILDAPEVEAKKAQALSAESAATAMSDMADNGAREEQIRGAYELWQ